MSLGVSVQIVVDGIFAAYERQDWSAIQRLGERVRMMILDGVADKDRGGLSEAASKLEIAHAMLPVATGETPQLQISWMLKADATLAKLAARRIPAPVSVAGTEERSARDKILRALIEANAPPSVSTIATMAQLARETVSRLLPGMAGQGLVRIKKIGRKTFTRITADGRAAIGQPSQEMAGSIRNSQGLRVRVVMTSSSSIALRQAHRMTTPDAKKGLATFAEEDKDAVFAAFGPSHSEVLIHQVKPVATPAKQEFIRMIFNGEGKRSSKESIMRIPA